MDFDIMGLQVEAPKTNIDDWTWTIYGDAGIGKSSLCAHLYDDPAFFQWEQGQNALFAKKIPVDNWKTFKKYVRTLTKAFNEGKTMPMKTAIMDTADFGWKKCVEYVCQMNGWSHPSDGEWGKGWDAVSTEWEMECAALENIGIKPVNISHSKDKEFKPKKGEKFDMILPSVPTGCLATIVDKVDFVVYCSYERVEVEKGIFEQVRRAYFRSNGDFKAKSRLTHMPDFIDFGESAQETAQRVRDAFKIAADLEFNSAPAPKKETKATTKQTKTETKTETKKATPPAPTHAPEEKKVEPTEAEIKEMKEENDAMVLAESGAEPTADQSPAPNLDAVKKEVEKLIISRMKEKLLTVAEVNNLVSEYCGVKKIADINDAVKAQALLEHVKTISI